ncbi:hypothetical protein JHK85_050489 [Glycine max]|nr:hypothetical protein JHK85_050489 [Glycine max]
MDQALAIDILTMLKRANTPPKSNYSKRYRYQHNHGHSTKEYNALKDKIQELIKLGHLKEFIHKPQSNRPNNSEKAPKVVHHVEAKAETKEVEELEINLRTNDNNRVKPVKETSTFQLEPKEG